MNELQSATIIRQVETKEARRERIAVACLSGMLARSPFPFAITLTATKEAIKMADLLIQQLDKTETT